MSKEKKRVLFVTQEMNPFVIESEIAKIARELPQLVQDSGMEIRVLMPKFGSINERRHRLHEVVRLSGINIIIDEEDYPLVIKVASLPGARMQVYFLDNDDFFKRKNPFADEKKGFYEDNAERMIFFCKGVLETVRKFGWPPDVIHCHGWMTSLIPLYVKTAYAKDPVFSNARVIYSVYSNSFNVPLSESFYKKAPISNAISEKDLSFYKNADNSGLNYGGAKHADAIILGSDTLDEEIMNIVKENGKPVMDFVDLNHNYLEEYREFYRQVIQN